MEIARPKVLLLIPHLGGGGAERVIELIASGLPAERFEVHLGVVCQSLHRGGNLPAHVQLHFLGARRVRASWWSLLKLVRRVKPQLILSGMAHLNFLVLLLRPLYPRRVKIVVRQNGALPKSRINCTATAYRLLYPRADAVIAQSEAMAAEISQYLGVDSGRVRALANPVLMPANHARLPVDDGLIHLLGVGRLSPEKGFDLLLRAFALLLPNYPSLRLCIAGEGAEGARLAELIASLGLHNYAELAGYRNLPFETTACDLFVLCSRTEGMPNVLLEALAHGFPIVATPCSKSVEELLTCKPGVWLAGEVSVPSLVAAIESALPALQPGLRFEHEFIAPFEYSRALLAYEACLREVLSQ